jgi:hypothetical protein
VFAVEVSKDGGNRWIQMISQEWNWWEFPNGKGTDGTKTFDIRITCSNGRVVDIINFPSESNSRWSANGNC